MNRTIKFQLSNIKKSYLYAALFTYGAMAIVYIIAFLTNTNLVSNTSQQPIWLIVLGLVFAPFTFLAIMYALFDGLMFFDTSLRFGISRKSYFITQLIIYVFLTLMLAIGSGLSEIAWTGTTATYFSQIATDYLSVSNLAFEFFEILGLGVIMVAIYRFKMKAIIPVILAGPVVALISLVLVIGPDENSIMVQIIFKIADFVIKNPEITGGILIAALTSIYYLFITKIEIQD